MRLQRNSIKSRPALVLKSPINDDYVVLPISSIPNRANVNPIYDIEIDPVKFPKMNLTRLSYVRTHRIVFNTKTANRYKCYNRRFEIRLRRAIFGNSGKNGAISQ
nr:hypothetical protein [uncultured Leptotrichia sp.]